MKSFKEINFGNVIITCLLIVVLLLTAFNTYSIAQLKQMITEGSSIAAPAKPAAVKRPSDYKIGEDYYKSVKSDKPMMLLFYADWCHFCIDFMPKFEALYKKYKHKYNFVKINVEDPTYAKEVEKYQIQGFPSVFLVNTQKDTHIQLDNNTFGDIEQLKSDLEDFYKKNK